MGCDREDSAEAVECLRRKPSRELVDQDVQPARYGAGSRPPLSLLGPRRLRVEGACGPQAVHLARGGGLQASPMDLPSPGSFSEAEVPKQSLGAPDARKCFREDFLRGQVP